MSSGTNYLAAGIQMTCGPEKGENVNKAVRLIGEAARRGAKVVCLQELFASQYFCQAEDHDFFALAEPIPGPTTERIQASAREHGVVVIASLFEKRAAGLYHNTAAVLDADGTLLGIYRKMHIPDDPAFYEKFYFTPGDTGFCAWQTAVGRIGVCICWDQWFPEAARATALRGADILFYPTAIGWHPAEKAEFGARQRNSWETIQRAHAIANGCYVMAVNRVGHEAPSGGAGIEFWGGSFACDPSGEVLAQAPTDAEDILLVEVSPAAIETQRTHWPFLRDRRTDAYGDLARRWVDGF